MKGIIPFAHDLLEKNVTIGETVVDGTCGNGKDTLFLSYLVGDEGKVIGFDIQQEAINRTQSLLDKNQRQNVNLMVDGHENMNHYMAPHETVGGAIFNLGYLPRGDHSVITTPDNTIKAIQSLQQRLKPTGRIVIVVYHGHEGGKREKDALLSYCEQIDQQYFQVLQYQFINQVNQPPFILAIEKITNPHE
ncbi:hypothetical protein J416_06777 [Gracilibacillus halophilus YIM-C55.5]|uniref:rRNA methylase n=1 Tax=Gracilibacillus halophilus YIM-C55.5 TaxID=1308866 RepID=N4WA20_9BACI|nr:class I SAM-dependent methyltransferase [Gracilibacillus halophilus]ENH97133.1 hypothetical protein J416_06777 [Gracilibacillus halophilus YIM-C55.5]